MKGTFEEVLGLSTLATKTLVKQDFADDVSESTWCSSIVASWSLGELTPATNDGPILVGIAHDDYVAAEIEDFVEATTSWDVGNLVQQEVAKRKIRIIGTFRVPAGGPTEVVVLNDGKPIRTKCNWMLETGQGLAMWAYNMGDSALATTNPQVHAAGHANLWPR